MQPILGKPSNISHFLSYGYHRHTSIHVKNMPIQKAYSTPLGQGWATFIGKEATKKKSTHHEGLQWFAGLHTHIYTHTSRLLI